MVSFPQVSPPEPCTPLSPSPYVPHAPPISFFSILPHAQYSARSTYRSLSSSLCNFLHSTVTSPLLGPNTLLNTLFSNTVSLRSSLNVSDQVSHPYRTTGNIIVLYILIFNFLDSKLPHGTPETINVLPDNAHTVTRLQPKVFLTGIRRLLGTNTGHSAFPAQTTAKVKGKFLSVSVGKYKKIG